MRETKIIFYYIFCALKFYLKRILVAIYKIASLPLIAFFIVIWEILCELINKCRSTNTKSYAKFKKDLLK